MMMMMMMMNGIMYKIMGNDHWVYVGKWCNSLCDFVVLPHKLLVPYKTNFSVHMSIKGHII